MSIFRRTSLRPHNKPKGNRRIVAASAKQKASTTDAVKAKRNQKAHQRTKERSSGNRVTKGENRRVPKPANGELNPESIADTVDESGPPIWPTVKPFVFSAIRLLAVLVSIAVVVLGGKYGYDYMTTSAFFAIQHVEIHGNERLSNAQVLEAAGFKMEQNIFSVDFVGVEKNLEAQPWIVEAKVKQQLPKTVIVDVVERKPEILILFDVLYLVDETGEIFKRRTPSDPRPSCVLTGVSKRELVEDEPGVQKVILDAISLRERYVTQGNQRYAKLYEIHREIDGGFSLTVGDDSFYVKLGEPPYRVKLTRLAKLFRKIGKQGKRPQMVYFDNEKRPDRVTVKFAAKNADTDEH